MLSRIADAITAWLGSTTGISTILGLIAADVIVGGVASFGSAWGTVNGAATGIISIALLVFLQHSSNRQSLATQIKLDALLVQLEATDSTLAGLEQRSEAEIRQAGSRITETGK